MFVLEGSLFAPLTSPITFNVNVVNKLYMINFVFISYEMKHGHCFMCPLLAAVVFRGGSTRSADGIPGALAATTVTAELFPGIVEGRGTVEVPVIELRFGQVLAANFAIGTSTSILADSADCLEKLLGGTKPGINIDSKDGRDSTLGVGNIEPLVEVGAAGVTAVLLICTVGSFVSEGESFGINTLPDGLSDSGGIIRTIALPKPFVSRLKLLEWGGSDTYNGFVPSSSPRRGLNLNPGTVPPANKGIFVDVATSDLSD